MSGRTSSAARSRIVHAVGALVTVLGLLLASLLISGPAGAATDNAQLGPTGPSDRNSPSGGSVVQVQPGDTVSFTTNLAPTSILRTLHLDSLASTLDGLLAGLASPGVTADFSHLPGGKVGTKLSGTTAASFHFTKVGSYPFTYTFDSVLLGGHTPLNLDGNQLKKAGVELNAKNQYVGAVVVSTAKPTLTLSGQLPKISVQPKVAGVSLPKITVPGVNLPSVRVPVPDLNPTKGGGKTKAPTKGGGKTTSTTGGSPLGALHNQPLPVPARVMGGGASGGGSLGGGGSNGLYAGSPLGNGQSLTLGGSNGTAGSNGANGTSSSGSNDQAAGGADKLAAGDPPSAQMPVVLAVMAIVALSLVASTYARLFLLRRPS